MSRSRKYPATAATAGVVHAPQTATQQALPRQRATLKFIAAATLCWSAVLLLLVVFTANPVVISRDQLRQSNSVVVAQPVAGAADRIKVIRALDGTLAEGEEV